MEQHVLHSALVRLFSGQAARGRWAELKRLPADRQLDRIKADPSLRTRDMFSTVLEEAAALVWEDPYLAEETAQVAHGLAGLLPDHDLQGRGHAFESEKLYRAVIAGLMETEQYKEAFLMLLILFESLFRRGELGKAARVCEEAIERIEEADRGCHAPWIEAWRQLLALVTARSLTDQRLLEARHALMRVGHEPAREPRAAPPQPGIEPRRVLRVAPPAPPTRFEPGDYKKALAQYDRQLIAAALEQFGGRLDTARRVLGISSPTLRERMKRYGLTGTS